MGKRAASVRKEEEELTSLTRAYRNPPPSLIKVTRAGIKLILTPLSTSFPLPKQPNSDPGWQVTKLCLMKHVRGQVHKQPVEINPNPPKKSRLSPNRKQNFVPAWFKVSRCVSSTRRPALAFEMKRSWNTVSVTEVLPFWERAGCFSETMFREDGRHFLKGNFFSAELLTNKRSSVLLHVVRWLLLVFAAHNDPRVLNVKRHED